MLPASRRVCVGALALVPKLSCRSFVRPASFSVTLFCDSFLQLYLSLHSSILCIHNRKHIAEYLAVSNSLLVVCPCGSLSLVDELICGGVRGVTDACFHTTDTRGCKGCYRLELDLIGERVNAGVCQRHDSLGPCKV